MVQTSVFDTTPTQVVNSITFTFSNYYRCQHVIIVLSVSIFHRYISDIDDGGGNLTAGNNFYVTSQDNQEMSEILNS